jgi:hypothetical protein
MVDRGVPRETLCHTAASLRACAGGANIGRTVPTRARRDTPPPGDLADAPPPGDVGGAAGPTARPEARLAAILAAFALVAAPLVRVGDPRSPAVLALERLGGAPELAIVGDSRVRAGVTPRLLVEALAAHGRAGVRAYNFGVDGTDALHHYSFAHRLLAAAPPPRVLLWACAPGDFDEARRANRLEQLGLADLPALARAGAPLEQLLDVATMALFPPYAHRPLVERDLESRLASAGLRALPVEERLLGLRYDAPPESRRRLPRADGQEAFEVLEWPGRFQRAAAAYTAEYTRLRVGAVHLALARRLLAEARQAGTLAVVLELPLAPWFREHLAILPEHQRWRAELERLAREEGALFVSDAERFDDDRRFGDPGHMPAELADTYSHLLGEALASEPRVQAALAPRPR